MDYIFANADQTSVHRSDGTIIAWNPTTGGPAGGGHIWQQWELDGSPVPDDYAAPAPSFSPLSPRQLRLMMLQIGLTDTDVEAQIAAIPDPTERAAASIEWQWATRYDRTHPLVITLAIALEFTDAELDALWSYAADL